MEATAEKSLITVLIVDTVSSTEHVAACDPDDAQEFLDQIFDRIHQAITSSNGHLVSFAGDGGVAVFGWPDSLENHADKACEAALRINSTQENRIIGPDGKAARFRIGIHSGLVGLRQITLSGTDHLDTVGGTVHLAAALEKRAPIDGILISGSTFNLCRYPPNVIEFEDLPIFRSLGIGTFQIVVENTTKLGVNRRVSLLIPIFGRESEVNKLRKALPLAGRPFCCLAVIGEPGIGKSRLLDEVSDVAELTMTQSVRFDGYADTKTNPYSVFRSFLIQLLVQTGISKDLLLEEPVFEPEDRLFVKAVLDEEINQEDIKYSPSQTQIIRAVLKAIIVLSRSEPMILIVDDLQLVDPESLSCLSELAINLTPIGVTLFVSARTETADEAKKIATHLLKLEPLSNDAMLAIAQHQLSGVKFANEEIERVVRKADGVPFVLEQILLSVDQEDANTFDLLPLRVHSLIHARLNKLTPDAKILVQGLSILHEQINVTFLKSFLDIDEAALVSRIGELQQLGFVRLGQDSSVHFRHSILADACLTTVPKERRVKIHQRAVKTILHLYSDTRYDILAFHYEGAGQYGEAITYLWKAGLQARRTSAMGSLQLIFARALSCIKELGSSAENRYVDFVLMAGSSALLIGEFEFIRSHFPKALAIALEQGRAEKACGALCQLATLRWFEGEYSDGLSYSVQAVEQARQLDSLPHLFAAQMVHSILLWLTADVQGAIKLQSELCDMLAVEREDYRLGAAAMPSVLARIFKAWAQTDIGLYDESLAVGREALEIAKRTGDPYAEALALSAIGNTLLVLGQYAEACTSLHDGYELCIRNGYLTSLPTVIGNYSIALSKLGRVHDALEINRKWLESDSGDRTGHFELFYQKRGYAELLVCDNRLDEGLETIEYAWRLADRVDSPCLKLRALELRSKVLKTANIHAEKLRLDRVEINRLCKTYGFVEQL